MRVLFILAIMFCSLVRADDEADEREKLKSIPNVRVAGSDSDQKQEDRRVNQVTPDRRLNLDMQIKTLRAKMFPFTTEINKLNVAIKSYELQIDALENAPDFPRPPSSATDLDGKPLQPVPGDSDADRAAAKKALIARIRRQIAECKVQIERQQLYLDPYERQLKVALQEWDDSKK